VLPLRDRGAGRLAYPAARRAGYEHDRGALGDVAARPQIRARDGVEEDVKEARGREDEVGEDRRRPRYATTAARVEPEPAADGDGEDLW
jgi:hypothetical protein